MLTGVFCLAINRCRSICAKYLEPLQIVFYDKGQDRVLQVFSSLSHLSTSARDLSVVWVLYRRKSGCKAAPASVTRYRWGDASAQGQCPTLLHNFCEAFRNFLMTGLMPDILQTFLTPFLRVTGFCHNQ